jgi:uncharacterized protein DUF3883
MENNHKLAMYVAYYLSRYNEMGLSNLGYNSWNNAFEDVAKKLNVKRHSVKNWRDEFDPLFGHRVGWYQRPMIPSRVKVAFAFENLNEEQIRGIVNDILSGKINDAPDEEVQLLSIVTDNSKEKNKKEFVSRGPTGKAAEIFFIDNFNKTGTPREGQLIDCRDLGCGYDFKIQSDGSLFFIEVKGIAEFTGGVLFTDKEWSTAKEKGNEYFLCVVKKISTTPEISFIQNPAFKLIPKKNIYTTIQINWQVNEVELNKFND